MSVQRVAVGIEQEIAVGIGSTLGGFIIMAQSAGQRVKAEIMERPTDVAMVIPNWV